MNCEQISDKTGQLFKVIIHAEKCNIKKCKCHWDIGVMI